MPNSLYRITLTAYPGTATAKRVVETAMPGLAYQDGIEPSAEIGPMTRDATMATLNAFFGQPELESLHVERVLPQ